MKKFVMLAIALFASLFALGEGLLLTSPSPQLRGALSEKPTGGYVLRSGRIEISADAVEALRKSVGKDTFPELSLGLFGDVSLDVEIRALYEMNDSLIISGVIKSEEFSFVHLLITKENKLLLTIKIPSKNRQYSFGFGDDESSLKEIDSVLISLDRVQ